MKEQSVLYQFDTIEVQPAACVVTRDGRPIELEPKAFRVLLYLIEHRERAVSKEELMEVVWRDTAVTDNALTRIVAQIRRELGDDARQPRFIQTLPTLGYRFVAAHTLVRAGDAPPSFLRSRARRFWLSSAAGLLLTMLAIYGWLAFQRGILGWSRELRTVQLTTSAGLDVGASLSPTGNAFVYSSNRSGRFEIYEREVSSAGEGVQLTDDGEQNIEPAWSPDGKWIAYHSVAKHGIWLIPVSGGPVRQLTAFGSEPSWSPDGRQVAFCAAQPISFTWADLPGVTGGAPEVWTVAADGSQLRQVTAPNQPPGQHMMPSWSPDGKELVFVAVARDSAIWKLNLASGKLDLLVQIGRDIPRTSSTRVNLLRNPRFHPAGKGLYFCARNDMGSYAIYLLRASGERPRAVYTTRGDAPFAIGLSPDGRRLIFTRFTNISQLWSIGPSANAKPVFQEAVLRAYRPSFSPDGKLLAFMVETVGRNFDLWVMNADGTGVRPVSSDPGTKETSSIWNLEGTGLHYNYFDGPRVEFRRYDTGRKATQVLYSWPSQQGLYQPALMPDEQEVVSACSQPLNICLSAAQGGPPRQITFERVRAAYPSVSRDGQWIAYEMRRGDSSQIGITDRNGGHQEMLTDGPGLNFPGSFSADGRRLSYAAYRDGVWNLWWIDRITRERRQVTRFTSYGPYVRYPAWRPGSEEIVYEYSQVKGNVYLLDLP
jgi:Tol biopolymer transport system component/DNA-binding winged helix-turn-helix (wHTH) protein